MKDIETLVAELEQLPEVPREKARALVEATLALHRDGLARILELGGAPLREAAVHDGLVSALLALHDLHPLGLAERARAAVERARAELGAAGVHAELVSVENGVVRARVQGAHAEDARRTLGDALWVAAPDAVAVEIEAVGPVVQLRVGA